MQRFSKEEFGIQERARVLLVMLVCTIAALAALLRGRFRLASNIFVVMITVLMLFSSAVTSDTEPSQLATGAIGAAALLVVFFARIVPGNPDVPFGNLLNSVISNGIIYLLIVVVAYQIVRINRRTLQRATRGGLRTVAGRVSEVSASVYGQSTSMADSAHGLTDQAQQQAATLEQTSAAIEQLTASVDQVSRHAQSPASSVEESTSTIQRLQETMGQISRTLEAVLAAAREATGKAGEGAGSVDRVVESIRGIAALIRSSGTAVESGLQTAPAPLGASLPVAAAAA